VVPLRYGAGVKLKVVEAVHEGTPLVTTQVGTQGLEGLGTAVPILDEAESLAKELVRLLRDDAVWLAQSARQLDYAKIHFSREASIASLIAAAGAAITSAKRRKSVAGSEHD